MLAVEHPHPLARKAEHPGLDLAIAVEIDANHRRRAVCTELEPFITVLLSFQDPEADSRSKVDEQREFLTLAKQDRPEDLGSLLATPWPATKWRDGLERLSALAARRPDPRLSKPLLALSDPKLYDSAGSHPFWVKLWTVLLELGDAHRGAGDAERAETAWARGFAVGEEIGFEEGRRALALRLAEHCEQRGEKAAAERWRAAAR